MKQILQIVTVLLLIPTWAAAQNANSQSTQSFRDAMEPLLNSSCVDCHEGDNETGLDLSELGSDLSEKTTFAQWERIFKRVSAGEMPPKSEDRPDPNDLNTGMTALKAALHLQSLRRQNVSGRVTARRLTKREFGNTLRDLLFIDGAFEQGIPDEMEAGSFDTVGANQRLSSMHMEGYLAAVDKALNEAIQLGRNPYQKPRGQIMLLGFMRNWHDKPLNEGGGISRIIDDGKGVALFRDTDYLTAFAKPYRHGKYRIIADVAGFQSKTPVTAKFLVKSQSGSAKLIKSVDLPESGQRQTVEIETFLEAGDTPYLTLVTPEPFAGLVASGGSKTYKGRGLAIYSQKIEGPLVDSWPPRSTQQIFTGIEIVSKSDSNFGPFKLELTRKPIEHIEEILTGLAARFFRRPVSQDELQPFLQLAKEALDDERSFIDSLRISLSSMLTSPQFLLFKESNGELDDHAIANRLSYFIWKSLPDDELFELASQQKLSNPEVLEQQVDRMLNDSKSERFVADFVGQWLRLYHLNVTSPDEKLYPEYDELLADAIPMETELFFQNLIDDNLSLTNLVDSDFTFVNRRLAEHYQFKGVKGQDFQKIDIPIESKRGGILTQAAILKTTANGTTTSPVMRGNFVLTNLLGTPPSPPPPSIGSIEPDTRGKTTIREILAAHRDMDSCATCHRNIDPPGFALESFDPIGGFRKRYRASNGIKPEQAGFFGMKTYKRGPKVDPSGITSNGIEFSDVSEFKALLLNQKDQIARNFIEQLVTYSTGAEIQFADKEVIDSILDQTRDANFPVRLIIHKVVQSRLIRNK
jgi:hypothetical protein